MSIPTVWRSPKTRASKRELKINPALKAYTPKFYLIISKMSRRKLHKLLKINRLPPFGDDFDAF